MRRFAVAKGGFSTLSWQIYFKRVQENHKSIYTGIEISAGKVDAFFNNSQSEPTISPLLTWYKM